VSNETLSLQELLQRFPRVLTDFKRNYPASYDEFVQNLYDDIVIATKALEESANKRQKDDEDTITLNVCNMLDQHGAYKATHDTYRAGHVDLTVQHLDKKYKWSAEAKIFHSVSAINEGFLQLTTRYKFSPPEDRGGMLIYVFQPNASAKMGDWRGKLEAEAPEGLVIQDCNRRPKLNFYSELKHKSTGLPFHIWHHCVVLHYEPKDKSARNAKGKSKKGAN
jgi:hypothetical protein